MLSEEKEKVGFEFQKAIEKGKKYEAKIQGEIEYISHGEVFNNVRLGNICEFDVIVADYPLMIFVEIKAYRQNLRPERVRKAVRKLRHDAFTVVEDETLQYRCWTPCLSRKKGNGTITNKELLFEKLELEIKEGWKFRLVLIVPNKVFGSVITCLTSYRYSGNIFNIYGIPLLVIPEKRVYEVF